MADQIERLIEAVEDVARKLTRLSTYEYLLSLGSSSTGFTSAVSGALGYLTNLHALRGTVSAVSALAGAMGIEYFRGGGSVAASGGAAGAMDISRQLAGSAGAVSNVANVAILSILEPRLYGSISCQSIVGSADLQL